MHSEYGAATVYNVYEATEKFDGGLILVLNTEEGRLKLRHDRNADLPRCFEDDLTKVRLID